MEYNEAEDKFRFFVKKWLQDAKICRSCATVMDASSGGALPDKDGNYPENPKVCETFIEYRCPKCNQHYREETRHIWKKE